MIYKSIFLTENILPGFRGLERMNSILINFY